MRQITHLIVRTKPGDRSKGLIVTRGLALRCALGRSGVSASKREGDGATPLASMRILGGMRRGFAPAPSALVLVPVSPDDGWCDTPGDRNYNRPVRLPYKASHERLFRDDPLYDVCLVLDWNISCRRRGRGSAIFLHLAWEGYPPTEGCVALSRRDMARLLPLISAKTRVLIAG